MEAGPPIYNIPPSASDSSPPNVGSYESHNEFIDSPRPRSWLYRHRWPLLTLLGVIATPIIVVAVAQVASFFEGTKSSPAIATNSPSLTTGPHYLEINSDLIVHGSINGITNPVGETDTQTLTNKTLSGAQNIFSNIPTSALDSNFIDIITSTGTNRVSLGGSVSLGLGGGSSITNNTNIFSSSFGCGDCVLNDAKATSTTQTIAPNADITSLAIRQSSVGNPTKDIFDITSASGSTVYQSLSSSGAWSINPAKNQNLTIQTLGTGNVLIENGVTPLIATDDTNLRLGIGTTSPNGYLDIVPSNGALTNFAINQLSPASQVVFPGLNAYTSTFAKAVKAGDFLILVFSSKGFNSSSAIVLSVSDSVNGTWTKLYDPGPVTDGQRYNTYAVYYLTSSQASGAGTMTVTVSVVPGQGPSAFAAMEISGVDPNNPFDVSALQAPATNSPQLDGTDIISSPVTSAALQGDFVLGLMGVYSDAQPPSFHPGSGFGSSFDATLIGFSNQVLGVMEHYSPSVQGPLSSSVVVDYTIGGSNTALVAGMGVVALRPNPNVSLGAPSGYNAEIPSLLSNSYVKLLDNGLTNERVNQFLAPTLKPNVPLGVTAVSIGDAATLYIDQPPVAGSGTTISRASTVLFGSSTDQSINILQSAADTVGRTLTLSSGMGNAVAANTGQRGGNVNVTGGAASANGAGSANGGNVILSGGAGAGGGTIGQVQFFNSNNYIDSAGTLNLAGGLNFSTNSSTLNLASQTAGNTFNIKIPKLSSGSCSSGSAQGIIFQDTSGTQVGHACLSGSQLNFYANSFNPGGTDVAENYSDLSDSLQSGDVVSVDRSSDSAIIKSTSSYQQDLLGVVSTNPGIQLSGISEQGKTSVVHPKLVALSGRVPVKFSAENGDVSAGDFLTSSATKPGYAMKATSAGEVIGIALGSAGQNSRVTVFVNLRWYDPGAAVYSQNGVPSTRAVNELSQITQSISMPITPLLGKITIDSYGDLKLDSGLAVSGTGSFSDLKVKGSIELYGILNAPRGLSINLGDGNSFAISGSSGSKYFTVDRGGIQTNKINITQNSLNPNSDSVGSTQLRAHTSSVVVNSTAVSKTSKILLSFEDDYSPATSFWVDQKIPSQSFRINLNQQTTKDITVDWWVIN